LEARLDAEVERLAVLAASLERDDVLPEAFCEKLNSVPNQLAGAGPEAALPLRFYRLRQPFVLLETLVWVSDFPEAGRDLARLEALWRGQAQRFEVDPAPVGGPPLLVALTQRSANRAAKLYRAALPYGRVSSPLDGLYYLGEALGELRFSNFVASLLTPERDVFHGPAADDAAVAGALDSLESEMVEAFAADPGSPTMVPVSARLKEARELLESGRLEPAALVLLESRFVLSRRAKAAPADPGPAGAPPARSAVGGWSLVAPFLGMAETEQDREIARLVHAEILPFHASLVEDRP
jgi:hypothetical protein